LASGFVEELLRKRGGQRRIAAIPGLRWRRGGDEPGPSVAIGRYSRRLRDFSADVRPAFPFTTSRRHSSYFEAKPLA